MANVLGTVLAFLILIVVMALVGVLPLWLGWNFGPADAFNWPHLSFWQALASSFTLAAIGSCLKSDTKKD